MGTKIDFVAALKPLIKIGRTEELTAEKRLEIILESMEEVLEQAEK